MHRCRKDDGTIHKTGQPACFPEKSEGLARMFSKREIVRLLLFHGAAY